MADRNTWTSAPPPKRALRRPRWYWVRVAEDDPYPAQFAMNSAGDVEYLSRYGWTDWPDTKPFERSVAPIEEPGRGGKR